jgi:hypothetical protein
MNSISFLALRASVPSANQTGTKPPLNQRLNAAAAAPRAKNNNNNKKQSVRRHPYEQEAAGGKEKGDPIYFSPICAFFLLDSDQCGAPSQHLREQHPHTHTHTCICLQLQGKLLEDATADHHFHGRQPTSRKIYMRNRCKTSTPSQPPQLKTERRKKRWREDKRDETENPSAS